MLERLSGFFDLFVTDGMVLIVPRLYVDFLQSGGAFQIGVLMELPQDVLGGIAGTNGHSATDLLPQEGAVKLPDMSAV